MSIIFMGENEQGGMLRVVIVLSLIAMLGIIFTKAVISQSNHVKNNNQNTLQKIDNSKSDSQSIDLNIDFPAGIVYSTGPDFSTEFCRYVELTTEGISKIDWDGLFKPNGTSTITYGLPHVESDLSDLSDMNDAKTLLTKKGAQYYNRQIGFVSESETSHDFHAVTGDSAKNATLKSITLDESKYSEGAKTALKNSGMFNSYSSASELMSHYNNLLNQDIFYSYLDTMNSTKLYFVATYEVKQGSKTQTVTKNVTFEQLPSSKTVFNLKKANLVSFFF